MRRLTTYLARLFATDALVLFGIVCFLLWMVNCLRQFEVVSVKGQGVGTLAVQALYTMPPLALAFFYICVGIGLVRALTALQASRELHIIHTSRGLSGLWRAAALVIGVGAIAAMMFSHWLEPLANRKVNELSASIAADPEARPAISLATVTTMFATSAIRMLRALPLRAALLRAACEWRCCSGRMHFLPA